MKLRETIIHLVGFYKSSIENNILIGSGITNTIDGVDGNPIADLFVVEVFDPTLKRITEGILVIFNQVEDKIVFLYRKDKFDVVSISEDIIRLTRDGIDYTIERLQMPF